MVMTATPTAQDIRSMLDVVVDPDIPVLTIAEIGILRDVTVTDDGKVEVSITPTYSGCPALAVMEEDVTTALANNGIHDGPSHQYKRCHRARLMHQCQSKLTPDADVQML
jgi:ring-1,2-phenylacetyl-CoA epoxidase subunit PaaD